MIRPWMWPVAGMGVGLIVVVIYLMGGEDPDPSWTSPSAEALEELQLGLDDEARSYWTDAVAHFERVLELDPDMWIAKLKLARLYPSDDYQRQELWQELEQAPKDLLSPRERFLISYWLARHGNRADEAEAILAEYMADREQSDADPYGLAVVCDDRWENQSWDEAETCYRRLISLHPNWVQAQRRLGLIAMAKGEFDQADESFQTFRYIAPDQAAPYDSLGQLQTVLGQYEAAEESFEQALRVKADYCMAVLHLQRLYSMWGKWQLAAEMTDRMENLDGCGYIQEWGLVCKNRAWSAYAMGRSDEAAEILDQGCLQRRGGFDLLAYRMAVLAGEETRVESMESEIEGHIGEKDEAGFQGRRSYLESLLLHAQGIRSFVAGDWSTACGLFRQSDDLGLYWGLERAAFKLYNRQHLLRCLEKAGHPTAAAAIRGQIDTVNPRYLEVDRLGDLVDKPD